MTRYSISFKLIGAFVLVSLIGTAVVTFFAGRTTNTEFDRLFLAQARANFSREVLDYYQRSGSWEGINRWLQQRQPLPPGQPPPLDRPRPQPPLPPPRPPAFALADQQGRIIVPGPPYRPGERLSSTTLAQGQPLELDGQRIGTVLDTDQTRTPTTAEAQYIRRVNRALLYATLGATVIALLLAIFLARTLTRPLRELTEATRAVARGQLEQTVPVRSRDELGQLATAFNRMSTDLAYATQLRRQMTADIAHDLRSPLAVLTGYIESLRDGVLQPKPSTFEVMDDEVQHLRRLIEDLRTLSLADANELPLNRQPVTPRQLLERLATAYQHQAEQQQATIQVRSTPDLPEIQVDPERMAQVLGNLVNNALRYVPAEKGQIILAGHKNGSAVILTVQDNGSGIGPDDLERIFDRFYRVDESRQQNNGESGLGLAIAKSIVEAHGGSISAVSRVGQGTTFKIELPLSHRPP